MRRSRDAAKWTDQSGRRHRLVPLGEQMRKQGAVVRTDEQRLGVAEDAAILSNERPVVSHELEPVSADEADRRARLAGPARGGQAEAIAIARNGRLYPDISTAQKAALTDNLLGQ